MALRTSWRSRERSSRRTSSHWEMASVKPLLEMRATIAAQTPEVLRVLTYLGHQIAVILSGRGKRGRMRLRLRKLSSDEPERFTRRISGPFELVVAVVDQQPLLQEEETDAHHVCGLDGVQDVVKVEDVVVIHHVDTPSLARCAGSI